MKNAKYRGSPVIIPIISPGLLRYERSAKQTLAILYVIYGMLPTDTATDKAYRIPIRMANPLSIDFLMIPNVQNNPSTKTGISINIAETELSNTIPRNTPSVILAISLLLSSSIRCLHVMISAILITIHIRRKLKCDFKMNLPHSFMLCHLFMCYLLVCFLIHSNSSFKNLPV